MADAPTERGSFFDQFRNRSPVLWLCVALILVLNGLYDYYDLHGIVIDVIIATVLVIAYFRYRSAKR
jgi:hypothetical protein